MIEVNKSTTKELFNLLKENIKSETEEFFLRPLLNINESYLINKETKDISKLENGQYYVVILYKNNGGKVYNSKITIRITII